MSRSVLESTGYLDEWAHDLSAGESVRPTIEYLFAELNQIRLSVRTEEWNHFVTEKVRPHPLHRLLMEEPLSRRAFEKPRGYAGDAMMLDYVYAVEDCLELPQLLALSDLGRRLYFDWMVHMQTSRAVRTRRAIIRGRLNELSLIRHRPDVLSVACGHLREAVGCSAIQNRRLGRLVAVDQDEKSLSVVRSEYAQFGVEAVRAGIGDIIRGRFKRGEFDFIYATGLYDYLPSFVAQRLTSALFAMLRPGGTLLLANILPHVESRGYLEACLDWWMVYRSRSELAQLAAGLDPRDIDEMRLFTDPHEQFAFLEVDRRS